MADAEAFRNDLLRWYDADHRKLPWRGDRPDPYHVLVSEAMLQQTQVATVIAYFDRFMAELPTVEALAETEEQTVLRLWQGLGYYRRARNLHTAGKRIVADFGGQVPATVEQLLTLPGVGRYTAGAIASLAFGVAAPILDGNVQRVLCRVDAIEEDPRTPAVQKRLWRRAEQLVPSRRAGAFNSALMELGATVCTPTSPRCLLCPVSGDCKALRFGLTDRIPLAKKTKATPLVERDVYVVRRGDGAVRIEQRPTDGRWARMWQFTTVERHGEPPITLTNVRAIGEVRHALTHRRYHFRVFAAEGNGEANGKGNGEGVWVQWPALDTYPLPKPHLRMRDMAESGKPGR